MMTIISCLIHFQLKRLLKEYVHYYHLDRTHLGLEKDTPGQRQPRLDLPRLCHSLDAAVCIIVTTLLPSRVDSQLCLLRVSGKGLSASRFDGVRLSLHGLDTALGLRLISKFKLGAPTFLLHERCAFNFGEGQALPLENPEMDGQVLLGVLTNGFDQAPGLDQQLVGVVVDRRIVHESACRAVSRFQLPQYRPNSVNGCIA